MAKMMAKLRWAYPNCIGSFESGGSRADRAEFSLGEVVLCIETDLSLGL